jgi:cob(I)alamin adenosyltransferase
VAKHSLRVTAYGTVDETNATVGLARLHAEGDMDAALARIQNDLFDLGADLCCPRWPRMPRRLSGPAHDRGAGRAAGSGDRRDERIGGAAQFHPARRTPLAAHLHLCRTVSRRAERMTVELATMEEVNEAAVKYLNRLSDWFFVASRRNNGGRDVSGCRAQTADRRRRS